jgi:hypothetical protein
VLAASFVASRGVESVGEPRSASSTVVAFAFDHLGAAAITSGAFLDNPASLEVSRKLGYRPNGVRRLKRREGELALNQALILTPEDFVRGPHPLVVSGLAELRAFIGLDDA